VKAQGFSLIEFMVVICLITLLACLGGYQFSWFDSVMARTEVDKLYAFCRYVQQRAIATNKELVVSIDTKNNSYQCENLREVLPKQIVFGVMKNIKGPPSSPAYFIDNPVTFQHHEIRFYPTGIISSGTAYLVDRAQQYMYALSNAVSSVSYLRLYRYDGRWKIIDPSTGSG